MVGLMPPAWAHLFCPPFGIFGISTSGYRAFIALSRIISILHDSLLFGGITDLINKVEQLGKALVTGNPILASRTSRPIDIFGQ